MALGINNLTSYYDFSPFDRGEIRALNTYAARCGYLIRQGRRDSRVALFYPEAAMWATYKVNTNPRQIDRSPEMTRLEEIFYACSWDLLARQVDYDYIDAEILESGTIEDGRLRYNGRAYECVVLPGANRRQHRSAHKAVCRSRRGHHLRRRHAPLPARYRIRA